MELLERDEQLQTLQKLRQRATAGDGTLLFVEGAAGIGKTALLQTFCRQQKETSIHWGSCDPLHAPRSLGLLNEIAAGLTAELQRALLEDGERMQMFGAFLSAVSKSGLVVFEDLHWADQATLDFLRYVGRRIDRTQTLLIGSFRNDEVGPAHPLRVVLGDLATSGARRLALQPLSLAAIKRLIGERNIDSGALYRATGGNPFFVTEVLAIGRAGVPLWVYRGRWTEVSGVVHVVLADARSPAIARMTELIALGRLRARRGDQGVWEALNEAKELAGKTETLQLVACPVAFPITALDYRLRWKYPAAAGRRPRPGVS